MTSEETQTAGLAANEPPDTPEDDAKYLRATLSVAVAVGMSSMSFNFWVPFLPLFLRQIGAKTDAEAVFWVALATTVQGITRLVTGPIWGVLSDRFGRKLMFLRALYFGTATTLIMTAVTAPWQVAIAFACQGLFSGFVPASVALTSVTVPERRLNSSLGLVTGAQYLGNTIGPAIGALFAIVAGYRGAIFLAALLPAACGTAVIFFVPTDRVRPVKTKSGEVKEKAALEPFRPSFQFGIAVFIYFVIFALTQLLRIVTPVALKEIHEGSVKGITGIAFTLGGLSSAFSVLVIAARFFKQGRLRWPLATASVLAGCAHLVLALSGTVPMYVTGFALIALMQAAMIPATNTLIAANVTRSRRGTAFGVAGSAQALAFMAGPMAAALFTALSLQIGFLIMGGIFISLGLLILALLREPQADAIAV